MRILMVAHTDAPWIPHFTRFFTARGDTLLVVSFAPYEVDGVKGIDVEFVGIEPFDKYKNKHVFFTRIPRVRRIIRRFQPDLVLATYLISNGLTAALSWKGPLAVSAVGGDVLKQDGRGGWRRRLREKIVQFVSGRADLIHSVSQEITDELIRLGVPPSKIIQLAVGVDPEQFCPAEDMPRPQGARFVTIRKHEPIYDNATIIEALALLKGKGRTFHCTFACDGTLFEQHKAQARAAGLDDCVTFTGNLPHGQLPDLLRQADIYLSASLSDGTSVSLLEGMATGLLPVVTRIPANEPWVVHGRTGLLFEPGSPESLAQQLETAMDDAELRKRAFEENRGRVNDGGNMPLNLQRLAEALEGLVSGDRPR